MAWTAKLVTDAMRREIKARAGEPNALQAAEAARNYPEAATLGRVIVSDTALVVVDRALRDRIVARDRVTARELLAGSVQIYSNKIAALALEPLPGRREIYFWPHTYDPGFLGYMAGALHLQQVAAGDAMIY